MLPPSSVTRNPSKQKRSASCAELWIIGRNDTTTQRRCALAIIGYLESWKLATASPSERRTRSLFQSKLLANRPRQSVFYLCVTWDRHGAAVYRICVKIVVSTVTL